MTIATSDRPTTIKVSQATHRRLKVGSKQYRSIEDYLLHLLEVEERQSMIESMRQAVLATPPEQLASWRAESDAWETTSLSDIH